MRITIIGTGYVGLVTGACFAEMGNDVSCMDIDPDKIAKLKSGISTIYEPGLDRLITTGLGYGRLSFTTDLDEAIEGSEVIFLTLPTPPGAGGEADLSAVLAVSRQLAERDLPYKVVVLKSTVPVGTADRVRSVFDEYRKEEGVDYDVASNPEFLREGSAVSDFMRPDRVVIGAAHPRAIRVLEKLYAPFVRQGNPILRMDNRSAELTKYAANSFLATKISFINEIANLCEQVGGNVDEVRRGMATDSRIGNQFLYPGLGFGGSCFPKDVRALKTTSGEAHYRFKILDAVLDVNKVQSDMLVDKIVARYGLDLSGLQFAVWGLAFKANTDDVRESPAIRVISRLLDLGAKVRSFDPEATETAKSVLGDRIEYARTAEGALEDSDALVICTEWPVFRRPYFELIRSELRDPVIFDGRNLYESTEVAARGLEYVSVGRPKGEPVGVAAEWVPDSGRNAA
jgi:UDPglucose 6-dehydrogenase